MAYTTGHGFYYQNAGATPYPHAEHKSIMEKVDRILQQAAEMIGSGFFASSDYVPSIVAGSLAVDVSAGDAIIGPAGDMLWLKSTAVQRLQNGDGSIAEGSIVASTTNYFFLKRAGTWHVDQDNTPPADGKFAFSGVTDTDDFTSFSIVGRDEIDSLYILQTAVESSPRWTKYTKTYAQLAAASTANDIELFSLAAGEVVHAVKIKHSAAFTGGGASAYTLSVGIAGNLTKYASAFNVFQAPGNTVLQLTNVVGTENHGAATSIRLAAVSTGANLDLITAGSVDVWVLTSRAV